MSPSRNAPIDTDRQAAKYRKAILNTVDRSILLANIAGSKQEEDLSVPTNCGGYGRIHHFRRFVAEGWPLNPLPIDPACRALGLASKDLLLAQVFQNAACPWSCWYCFVPYSHLAGSEKYGRWMTAKELLDLYLAEPDETRPVVIDLSGGAPDLTPEWIVWVMDELRNRGLEKDVYLWSDDNLSTDFLWTELSHSSLETMIGFKNYGRVCCFKGFDHTSFCFNTRAASEDFDKQFERFSQLLGLGIDLYGYVTLTTSSDSRLVYLMRDFVDRLQTVHPNLPLRIAPLRIVEFGPVKSRMDSTRSRALSIQDEAATIWLQEIKSRFSPALLQMNVVDVPLV